MIFRKHKQSCPVWHQGVFSSLNHPQSQRRCWGSVVLCCCFFTLHTLQHHHTIKWAQHSAARPSLTFTPRWMKSSNPTRTRTHTHKQTPCLTQRLHTSGHAKWHENARWIFYAASFIRCQAWSHLWCQEWCCHLEYQLHLCSQQDR